MGNSESSDNQLAPGVYEQLVTDEVMKKLSGIPHDQIVTEFIDSVEGAGAIARHVAAIVERKIAGLSPEGQLAAANQVIESLNLDDASLPGTKPEQLLEISAPNAPRTARPAAGLNAAALLTNARGEPALGTELKSELASADKGVDLLSAFIRWTGLRTIEDELQQLKERGIPLRVLTTTYIGATEKRALDELVTRFGAQVKVNYETNSTRLHAKAWMFKRSSGVNTAYVGSSNLSHAALIDGLEWNVRLSEAETPSLMRKFESTFESYWNLPEFEPYSPADDGERLTQALTQSAKYDASADDIDLSSFQLRPYPHQEQVLEALTSERLEHGRHRNLVIAATGTGKTIIAALDYGQLSEQFGKNLTLLFVAHRKEILQQSVKAYRAVLMDSTFGELLVDGQRPTKNEHVFASVQSLSGDTLTSYDPSAFDVIVVDEFHHAEAPTYRRILEHFKPKELLGLTATPERGDSVDVKEAFFDGRAAAEIRLWDALAADLLVPFHYFGISDNTDLSEIAWNSRKGSYEPSELTRVYTGESGRLRAGIIGKSLKDKVTSVGSMRALGFCATVDHARFMTDEFNAMGILSRLVVGETSREERSESIAALKRGDVRCLFTVDVFNEGLDIPQIDTVLMLRPTQSSTIFLQQLGRGLRRAPRKSVLTVLDFIGFQRKEFKFENVLRAMTGATRTRLIQDIEDGFPYLPAGSQIVLDRVAQQTVLTNVRQQLRVDKNFLVSDVSTYFEDGNAPTLRVYLANSGRTLRDVYSKTSWTTIREALGVAEKAPDSDFRSQIAGRLKSLIHVDDEERARAYEALVSNPDLDLNNLSESLWPFAKMLAAILNTQNLDAGEIPNFIRDLRADRELSAEIQSIVTISSDASRRVHRPLINGLEACPLKSHATYTRAEILIGLGYQSNPKSHISGVAWCERSKTDALLVTLRKSEKRFSPSTMYHDYALSPERFHWESQNATSATSEVGRRYINHASMGTNIVLFTRSQNTEDEITGTYTCLGNSTYESHQGEKPMAITWRLTRPMPQDVYLDASTVSN